MCGVTEKICCARLVSRMSRKNTEVVYKHIPYLGINATLLYCFSSVW